MGVGDPRGSIRTQLPEVAPDDAGVALPEPDDELPEPEPVDEVPDEDESDEAEEPDDPEVPEVPDAPDDPEEDGSEDELVAALEVELDEEEPDERLSVL